MEPGEKPVLDYEPRPAAPTWRHRVGSMALIIAYTLAAPGIVLMLGEILIDPVRRHWIAGYALDPWVDTAQTCNIIGAIMAIVAIIFGKFTRGAIMLSWHLFSAIMVPAFGYA